MIRRSASGRDPSVSACHTPPHACLATTHLTFHVPFSYLTPVTPSTYLPLTTHLSFTPRTFLLPHACFSHNTHFSYHTPALPTTILPLTLHLSPLPQAQQILRHQTPSCVTSLLPHATQQSHIWISHYTPASLSHCTSTTLITHLFQSPRYLFSSLQARKKKKHPHSCLASASLTCVPFYNTCPPFSQE